MGGQLSGCGAWETLGEVVWLRGTRRGCGRGERDIKGTLRDPRGPKSCGKNTFQIFTTEF